ncbi:MAG: hypothetical protein ACOYU4_11435 [Thermodesulfobacteriota bacterium]
MPSIQDIKEYEKYAAARNIHAMTQFSRLEDAKEFGHPEICGFDRTPRRLSESYRSVERRIRFVDQSKRGIPTTVKMNLEETTGLQSESPFDQLTKLRDDKVLEIISYVQKSSHIPFTERLARRLRFLFDAAKEEFPDEFAISPESLNNFLTFLQYTPNLKYPDIVLTPSKNIQAQWRTASNRHFAVEFLPTGDARFVIFSPDPRHPEKTIRLSGLASIDSLLETAQPHGVLSWASE